MAYFSNESSIVSRPFVFEEVYVPDTLAGRSAQIEQIKTCLEPVKRQLKPLNCWVYGPSGSGKTCTVYRVLRDAEKSQKLRWTYINCWEAPRFYLVLDKLVRQLRILGAEPQIASVKLEALEKFLEKRPFVIVLDELDMIAPKERDAILYNLNRIEKLSLFCITYNHKAYMALDNRVRSRMNPVVVAMAAFRHEEIIEVLKQRAEYGLMSGSWSDQCLEKIAGLAEGNSRVAIQTLRNAAFLAERKKETRLTVEHIEQRLAGSGDLKKRYLLDTLTSHHRLLYEIVESLGVVASSDLWSRYLEECKARSFPATAQRTYTGYLRRLVTMRLIEEEFVIDRGRKRVFKVAGATNQG